MAAALLQRREAPNSLFPIISSIYTWFYLRVRTCFQIWWRKFPYSSITFPRKFPLASYRITFPSPSAFSRETSSGTLGWLLQQIFARIFTPETARWHAQIYNFFFAIFKEYICLREMGPVGFQYNFSWESTSRHKHKISLQFKSARGTNNSWAKENLFARKAGTYKNFNHFFQDCFK